MLISEIRHSDDVKSGRRGFANLAMKTMSSRWPQVTEQVEAAFRPEFLNRLDGQLLFKRLSREHMGDIVAIQLERLKARLAEKGFGLDISDKAIGWLAEKGYDPRFGARPLKRVIQTELQDKLATAILDKSVDSSHPIVVEYTKYQRDCLFHLEITRTVKAKTNRLPR